MGDELDSFWDSAYLLEDRKKRVKSLELQLSKARQELIDLEARLHDPMTWTFDEVTFSTRTYTCLKHSGMSTLGELTQRSATDLLRIKNFGTGCLAEVERILASTGLCLVRSKPRPIADVG